MESETRDLTDLQDDVMSLLKAVSENYKDNFHTGTIIMNLTTVSKEINAMIIESITGKEDKND